MQRRGYCGMKRISKPFLLIETFSSVWSEFYRGEVYEKSPRDFKQAKLYLELNNDFNPDNIVSRAKIYLAKNGYFADVRHNFTAFINNISSFVDEMPGRDRVGLASKPKPIGDIMKSVIDCPDCGSSLPEQEYHNHVRGHVNESYQ